MSNEIELSISCSDCVRRGTPDCADCLVSFVLGDEPDELVMTSCDADVVQLFTVPRDDAATEVPSSIDVARVSRTPRSLSSVVAWRATSW